jgi:hypothetical protein
MTWRTLLRVSGKALVIFALLNLLFAALVPAPAEIGATLYNGLYPGRPRFPFGENPAQSYNLSIFDLRAMFAAHEIDGAAKSDDEYRVLLVGDSSTWGTLLKPEETLTGQINARAWSCAGKRIRAYNLGYPTISLTKDLMIIDEAVKYRPDRIIWLTTLESFPKDKQLASPIAANNPARIRALIARYNLDIDPADPAFVDASFWQRSLFGQRRALADWIRLQSYGAMWSATGVDQTYGAYDPAATDFEADPTFHGESGPELDEASLSFDVLQAGLKAAGNVPVLLVNEPMLVSAGKNSDIRYNFFYPRWAYDGYRRMMLAHAAAGGWDYLDLWDLVPANEFTNSAIHLTPVGEALLAERIGEAICP